MTEAEKLPEEVREFKAAVESGDAKAVGQLLRKHRSVREQVDAPLFAFDAPAIVLVRDNRPMVEVLLAHGADINARSRWWAGGYGVLDLVDDETADWLIARGARLDAHSAAELGRVGALRALLDADPQLVHAPGGDGGRPLHFARNVEVAELLLDRGAEIDARDVDHRSTAAEHLVRSRPEVARCLVERGAAADVFIAVALADEARVAALIEAEPDCVNARIGRGRYLGLNDEWGGHIYQWTIGFDVSPAEAAHHRGHHSVYAMLQTASPPTTRLLSACMVGDRDLATEVADKDPDIVSGLDQADKQLLAIAAWHGKLEAVRLMLDLGFDPHVRGPEESTPLDRASFHGFADIVRLLLDRDPTPPLDWRNRFGGTPLGACVWGSVHGWRKDTDYPATAEALIRAGSHYTADAIPCGNDAVDDVLRRCLKPDQRTEGRKGGDHTP